jgi:hypothetical protein
MQKETGMQSNGTFDDRNEARLHVKQWLSTNDPETYSAQNIRCLVAATVRNDTDPVDGIHDSWREASYGAVMGIGEFAGEALTRLAQTSDDRALRESLSATHKALSCLPHEPLATIRYLHDAQQHIMEARPALPGRGAAPETQRALRALGLAQELLCQ